MTATWDAGFVILGIAAGLVHFHSLRWNTGLFITGGALRAFGAQVLRLATLAGVLIVMAWLGAMPLLLTALGVMIARVIATSPMWRSRLTRSMPGAERTEP
jgi:F1F0 ATPase subunit 2